MSKSTDYDKNSLFERIIMLSHDEPQDTLLINLNFTRLQFLEVKDKLLALQELISMVADDNNAVIGFVEPLIQQSVNELEQKQKDHSLPSFYLNTLSKRIVEYGVTAGYFYDNQVQTIQEVFKYYSEWRINDRQRLQDAYNYISISLELIEQIFQGLVIAKFIEDKFKNDYVVTIPFNEYYKLRAYDQFKDKDLLKNIRTECMGLDENAMLKTVDSFMKVNYFSVYGIHKEPVSITGIEAMDYSILLAI